MPKVRGKQLTFLDTEQFVDRRIPEGHPLRLMRPLVDGILSAARQRAFGKHRVPSSPATTFGPASKIIGSQKSQTSRRFSPACLGRRICDPSGICKLTKSQFSDGSKVEVGQFGLHRLPGATQSSQGGVGTLNVLNSYRLGLQGRQWHMLDFLGEIGSSVPWFYRGALYLISSVYRREMKEAWQRSRKVYAVFDITMTVLFFAAEVFIAVSIGLWAMT